MANCPWQVEDKRRNKTLVTLPQGDFCHSSSTDSRNYNSKIESIYKNNRHYVHAPPAGFGESNQLKDSSDHSQSHNSTCAPLPLWPSPYLQGVSPPASFCSCSFPSSSDVSAPSSVPPDLETLFSFIRELSNPGFVVRLPSPGGLQSVSG